MWVIFVVGIIASYIGLEKLLFLLNFSKARKIFLKNVELSLNGHEIKKTTGFKEFDTLLSQIKDAIDKRQSGIHGVLREFLICTVPELERHLSSISAWISVAPLLGLLGTVIGMVQTFKVIMDFGVGNPALTAEGISVALLTTEAGLTVAFPVMIFLNFLTNKKTALLNHILKDFEDIINRISQKVSIQ